MPDINTLSAEDDECVGEPPAILVARDWAPDIAESYVPRFVAPVPEFGVCLALGGCCVLMNYNIIGDETSDDEEPEAVDDEHVDHEGVFSDEYVTH
jgi:hypothetical protein